MHNVYVVPNATKRASSDYQTYLSVKNWWKKLENHESNSFSPLKCRNFGKKTTAQSTSDLLPEHQKFLSKHPDLMLKHQKWQHWSLPDGAEKR